MTTIKYFDGRKTVEVEVTEEVAAAYTESRREEWRSDKRAERHQTALSFGQMSDESDDGKVNDLVRNQRKADSTATVAADPLAETVERETREERRTAILSVLKGLTPDQRNLVTLLFRGLSVTEIAKMLGVGKTAVSNMRIRIQEKFKKVLK
jgi:RNA polymerase sigma factor (sigma-70 family)